MILSAAFAAAVTFFPAQEVSVGTLTGVVHGETAGVREPLAHAVVEVRTGGGDLTRVTDENARFRFEEIPAGHARVRVSRVGYLPLRMEVSVPPGGSVTVEVDLEGRPLALEGLTVRGEPLTPIRTASGTAVQRRAEMELRSLGATPGLAEAGLPGPGTDGPPSDPRDPAAVLLMRGSTVDLTRVTLDGAPIHTPFHMAGLLPAFDPGLLGGVVHHVGGAPARHSGGTSYVLDLRTRSPVHEGLRTTGSVDVVGAGATVEGRRGDRASVLASARTLHDLGSSLVGGRTDPFGFGDGLVRLETRLGERHGLRVTGFTNRERVDLDLRRWTAEREGGLDPAVARPARWGNDALSLRYDGMMGETGMSLTLAGSRYRAEVPLNRVDPALVSGEARTLRLAADGLRRLESGDLRFGGEVELQDGRLRSRSLVLPATSEFANRAGAGVIGAYLERTGRVTPELQLRAGLRGDDFLDEEGIRFSPRISLEWELGADALLGLGVGRYHQQARVSDPEARALLGRDAGPGHGQPFFPVASATHFVLSLDQEVVEGLQTQLVGFLKDFEGLPPDGSGLRSSGIDLRVLADGERIDGWLGYALSWAWTGGTRDGGVGDFTGRHLVSAGLRGELGSSAGARLRLAYGHGLPYTGVPLSTTDARSTGGGVIETLTGGADEAVEVESARHLSPSDGFLRIDAEVSARWTPGWGGRDGEIRPYLRLLNALDRRDALFFLLDPRQDPDPRPLAELPVIPVVGVEWSF